MQQAVFRKHCSLTPGTARRVVLGRQHVLHQTTLTRLPSTYIQSAKEEALVGSTSDSDACEPFNIQQELSNGSLARKAGGMLRDSKRQLCARAVADMHRLSALEPIGMVLFTSYVLGAVASYLDLPGPAWVPALTGAGMGTLFAALNRYYKVRVHAPPDQPLGVVLTGGSKGLGKALARELLLGGDRVLLTSRTQAGADEVVRQLKEELGEEAEVWGVKCDVSSAQDVKGLQQAAVTHLGRVDVWLNNAGYSGSFQPFIHTEVEQLQQVVSTNLLGVALCSREAARLFASQPEGGHLFNVDGAGADGFATPNYAAYGATKAGIRHLSLSLQAELKHTNTHIHLLSPGMILTDLLLEGATPQNKQAFNILCEHPEVTAAFLAPRIRSVVARGARNTYVQYLTPASALWRFLTAPARMGKYFDAEGNPVYPEELERMYGPKHAKATARKLHHHRRQNQGLQVAYSLSLAAAVCLMLLDAAAMNGGALRG